MKKPQTVAAIKKKSLGQFFTSQNSWLTSRVRNFIETITFDKVVDPFAGEGHLLKCFPDVEQIGYDIDSGLGWTYQDSLVSIPSYDTTALCVTNPPYLAKNIAKFLKLESVYYYFNINVNYDNLYLIALNRCLSAFKGNIIAIVPETFLLQPYFKDRLLFVNILEQNPFDDTDFAVLVACWKPTNNDIGSSHSDFEVYKNDILIGTWNEIQNKLPTKLSAKNINIKFNAPDGQLGLIGIDSLNEGSIRFCEGNDIKSDKIKVSSRHKTRIEIIGSWGNIDYQKLIKNCNDILYQIRNDTGDVVLAATKGNKKNGIRRRRLDFEIAKRIIIHALYKDF